MLIKRPADIRSSEITDEKLYLQPARVHPRGRYRGGRRGGCRCLLGRRVDAVGRRACAARAEARECQAQRAQRRPTRRRTPGNRSPPTTTSTSSAPTRRIRPSTRKSLQDRALVGGRRRRVREAGQVPLEDILKGQTLEERIYRLRCVEAWSMVIPWVGFPLAESHQASRADAKAKFIEFYTLADSTQMPGVRVRRRCAGRTSKGCGWTRRCTRSRFWPWDCTAR